MARNFRWLEMPSTAYLILKSLHIISIVAWMAGILYLYRLFVYHSMETEAVVKARFKVMESRLYRYITMPAMMAAVTFGIGMIALDPKLLAMPWLHAKLLFVAGLVWMTWFASQQIEALADGTSKITTRTFRLLNEVPTLLLALVVFLVVLKPFAKS